MKNVTWVCDEPGLSQALDTMAHVYTIAVDTEFIRESTFFPKVALIQLATTDRVWLIDPLALDSTHWDGLSHLLVDPRILKVMHAALGDQECLYQLCGTVVTPVLDTAVAAALLGHGGSIGLAKLLREVLGIDLPKGRARVHWLERPLSDELMRYAAGDVVHLVTLAESLLISLDRVHRKEWALELSQHSVEDLEQSPNEVAAKMAAGMVSDPASAGCLYELVVWRETLARVKNWPRGWITDNSVLVSLAKSRPKSMLELSRFRGLSPKLIQNEGKELLDAINRGKSRPAFSTGTMPRIASTEEEMAFSLLKAFLNILGNRKRVAPRFLVPPDSMLCLLRNASIGEIGWIEKGILSAPAVKLIGGELTNFLSGKASLGLVNGKVEVIGT